MKDLFDRIELLSLRVQATGRDLKNLQGPVQNPDLKFSDKEIDEWAQIADSACDKFEVHMTELANLTCDVVRFMHENHD